MKIKRYSLFINAVVENAAAHFHKKSTLAMLLEEIAELAAALEGTHKHSVESELIQICGICCNLWILHYGKKKK